MNSQILSSGDIRKVLESIIILSDLKHKMWYSRLNDEDDGTGKGRLEVLLDNQGDLHFKTDVQQFPPLRFRMQEAGGKSPRTRNALILLAEAIRLDIEEEKDK